MLYTCILSYVSYVRFCNIAIGPDRYAYKTDYARILNYKTLHAIQWISSLLKVSFYASVYKCYKGKCAHIGNLSIARFLTFTVVVIKGCGMGPWLVLVSSRFRENVVATCKIGSFLCSLHNLLQKNVIILFFGNQISKWRSFEKRAILTYFSHFLVTRDKLQ